MGTTKEALLTIKATVVSIRYRSPERNWIIATLKNHETKELFTATGDIPEGPTQLYGNWVNDKQYGAQFKVTSASRILPTDISGLSNYLAVSENIKGIGPIRAAKLVKFFGTPLLGILDKSPHRLAECPGINSELARQIANGWKRDSVTRQISFFLAKSGISPSWAGRILEQWEAGTIIQRIEENPYSLTAINGIGFTTADEMAQSMGWKKDSPQRTEAACIYILNEAVQKGNTYLHEGELILDVVKLIHPRTMSEEGMVKAEACVQDSLKKVIDRKEVIVEEVSDGTLDTKLIYLPRLYHAEKELAESIIDLSTAKHNTPRQLESIIAKVQEKHNVSYSTKQVEAIRGAFSNRIIVITGGPGTGKTTCTRAIYDTAALLERHAVLCAPTGRAAKRLSEVTGRTATTIHRMLKWGETGPQHTASNPIEAGILIVDESSMLDLELANKLFNAIPTGCTVVLIGDIDQLPAIGAGTALRDIIHSRQVVTIELGTIFRQAEASLIIRNAHLIKRGEMPRFPTTKGEKENSYVMWIPSNSNKEISGRDNAIWLKEKLGKLVCTSIPEKFKNGSKTINPIKDIQVLVPMKKYTLGTHELNRVLQDALNPNGLKFVVGGKTFRYGDRVMQMRNNYAEGMDIYNGDIGFITSNQPEEKYVEIDFDGRSVSYPYTDINDLQLAYAQTIHKSQGSEYPIVIVIMAYQHWPMLERNLLYTASTRAKELCLFMASKGAIEQAVKNNPIKARNTYLAQRLKAHR